MFFLWEKQMSKTLNSIVNLLITLIALWATYVSFEALFGVTIIFPFTFVEAEMVPYHRWQSVRLAVFLTVIYFSVMHLISADREFPSIYFLEIYLKILTIVGIFVFYKAQVIYSEFFVLSFFAFYSIIMHIARKKKYRYFHKR